MFAVLAIGIVNRALAGSKLNTGGRLKLRSGLSSTDLACAEDEIS